MRYLSLAEVIELHHLVVEGSGGAEGVRDLGALKSAVAQPRMSYSGSDLYPSLFGKAAALCYSLVQNHPFVDGNKRVGHAALETMLVLNGFELRVGVDAQEKLFLALAAGEVERDELARWIQENSVRTDGGA